MIGWALLVLAGLLIMPPPPVWTWLDVPWLSQNLKAFLGLQGIVAWSQLKYGRLGTQAVTPVLVVITIFGLVLLTIRPAWGYWPPLAAQAVLIIAIHIRARKAAESA